MANLTWSQYAELCAGVSPARVAKAQGHVHLEQWDVRRRLIQIFGFCNWDFTVTSCELVASTTEQRRRRDKQGNPTGDPYAAHTVVYRVIARLTLRDAAGRRLATYEDGATGDASNLPSLGAAHDFALKTALSQALKRCAVNLGDQFGLSLYDNGSTTTKVGRSLIAPERPADAPEVTGVGDDAVRAVEAPPVGPGARTEPTGKAVDLFEAIFAAEDVEALKTVWRDVAAAVTAGEIRKPEALQLQDHILKRQEEIREATP